MDTTLRDEISAYMYMYAGTGLNPLSPENLAHADRILALVAARLTSDTAVERAYMTLITAHDDDMRIDVRDTLYAALRAAGITKGEVPEGMDGYRDGHGFLVHDQ